MESDVEPERIELAPRVVEERAREVEQAREVLQRLEVDEQETDSEDQSSSDGISDDSPSDSEDDWDSEEELQMRGFGEPGPFDPFTYTKSDVHDAILHLRDACGAVGEVAVQGWFKRCECKDARGRKRCPHPGASLPAGAHPTTGNSRARARARARRVPHALA